MPAIRYNIETDFPHGDQPTWVSFVNYATGEAVTPQPAITDPSGVGFWGFMYDASVVEVIWRVGFLDGSQVCQSCTRESPIILADAGVLANQNQVIGSITVSG